ncbi:putative LRR receptor-like serine/threonine-protein kinase [Zea mays]|uniref:Putative LRR receptor-like serine/threonine-protein kinase n=1 Tax=Zea mays TaxID=4577 RepID=A0A1D6I2N8_MAIZE|nr:putative LRR receptor-like serine/threonine-protein kinase [Zea mays]
MIFLHFTDFQDTQLRQFDILINENQSGPKLTAYNDTWYLTPTHVHTKSYRADDGKYNVTLAATKASVLPPMINALEIYIRVPYESPTTLPQDFDAIVAIKTEYGLSRNWMGDPCFPIKYAWDGVKCSNASGNTSRITSLDLSNSSLHGTISKNFTLLTALENLDLSYNKLIGSIPDSLPSLPSLRVLNVSGNQLSDESLCKNYTGPLIFRF